MTIAEGISLLLFFISIVMIEKLAYIRKLPNGKFRVYSEKGRNMGTFSSKTEAKKRLQDIEFFKRKNEADDAFDFFRQNLDYGERERILKKHRVRKEK